MTAGLRRAGCDMLMVRSGAIFRGVHGARLARREAACATQSRRKASSSVTSSVPGERRKGCSEVSPVDLSTDRGYSALIQD